MTYGRGVRRPCCYFYESLSAFIANRLNGFAQLVFSNIERLAPITDLVNQEFRHVTDPRTCLRAGAAVVVVAAAAAAVVPA